MLSAFALVGLGSLAERTVEDQAVGSAHRQLKKNKNTPPCVPNWSQCDSPGSYSGSTTCCDGSDGLTTYSCLYMTSTYSQCKPALSPSPPSSPPSASLAMFHGFNVAPFSCRAQDPLFLLPIKQGRDLIPLFYMSLLVH